MPRIPPYSCIAALAPALRLYTILVDIDPECQVPARVLPIAVPLVLAAAHLRLPVI